MCFGGGDSRKQAYYDEIMAQARDTTDLRINPAWNRDSPYDYPKYLHPYNQEDDRAHGSGAGNHGGAGASQRGGYQPVQGMQVRAPSSHAGEGASAGAGGGSERAGGHNNPYGGTGRNAAQNPRAANSRRRSEAANSRRNEDNRRSRPNDARTSEAQGPRHPHRGTNRAAEHSNIQQTRFVPDRVPRRPSPPPLGRRR